MKYIESLKNSQVKQWKKLSTKKERQKTNTYLVEGFHLVEEALKFKDDIIEIIYCEGTELPQKWNIEGLEVSRITSEISKAISDTETAQGIFAVCKMKKPSIRELNGKSFLLLDAVQDPGNIGTMIRTADAAGMDAVILGEGTVDLYNPKVIRSAQGSHFHIDILTGQLDEWINKLQQEKISVYGTALENGIPFKDVEPPDSFALMVGNEGNGVSEQLLKLTKQNLYIPIHGQAESLNVAIAAGILMYYLKK